MVASDGSVVEAEVMGVTRSPISKYRDDEYHLVRLGPDLETAGRERRWPTPPVVLGLLRTQEMAKDAGLQVAEAMRPGPSTSALTSPSKRWPNT